MNLFTLFEGCNLFSLQEKDKIVRWTNLVDIFCGLTFYPFEHIAWARDKKLLQGKSDKLWDWGLYCWIGSLIACIIRDLWLLKKLHQQEKSKQISRSVALFEVFRSYTSLTWQQYKLLLFCVIYYIAVRLNQSKIV